jgi:arylformamidase
VSQMNKIIDLSWTIHEHMPLFPGDPALQVHSIKQVDMDGYAIKTIQAGMHVGTHLDAPAHFLAHGKTVETLDLSSCVGKATLITVQPVSGILPTEVIVSRYQSALEQHPILLIHTGWSHKLEQVEYFTQFPAFELSFIHFLEEHKIKTIGVDMPSIQFPKGDFSGIHQALLAKDIVIIENLIHLERCPSVFTFIGLPLKLQGFDGSMIRAIGIL